MFNNMLMGAAGESTKATGGYQVNNSGMFNDGSSQYLLRTPNTDATSDKINTVSFWFKRGTLGSEFRLLNARVSGGTGAYQLGFSSGDVFRFHPSISVAGEMNTTMVFRDPHAWYHIVASLDTTQSTEADRYGFWVNGVDMRDNLSGAKPAQNLTVKLNENGVNQVIAAYQDSSFMNYWDGYLSEFVVIDGQKLDADQFGEFDSNGVWRPIDVSGLNFGNNGYYLPFSNSVELGVAAAPVSSTAATVTFVAATTNSATASSYTFSSQSLSTAATGRIIAVVVAAERTSSGARTVSSLTVAGTSAALVVRQTSDNGDAFEIWEAVVASGTSGDIVVNFNASMDSCGIGVYAVYNAKYQQHFTIKAEGTSLSDTLVIPDNSIAIGGGHSTSTGATGTFVGLTENYDETIDSHISHAGGSTSTASSAGGGTTISYTSSSPHVDDTLIAATWFPSDGPNNFTGVNSPTQTTDTCTDNHGTWSPIISYNKGVAFSNGNSRSTTQTTSGDVGGLIGSFELPTAGKYYWEWVTNDVGNTPLLGWTDITKWSPTSHSGGQEINTAKFITGNDYNTGSGRILSSTIDGSTSLSQAAYGNFLTVSGGNPLANGSVLGCAYDADNGLAWFSFNNTWVDGNGTDSSSTVKSEIEAGTSGSQAFTTANGAVGEAGLFIRAGVQAVSSGDFTLRTRSDQWTGDCPSGFTALSTKNQAEAVTYAIEDGSAHFQATAYTGNGSANHDIAQTGNSSFQPDMVWGKNRALGDHGHRLFDAVRGVTKIIQSSSADPGATDSNGLTAFNSNGFEVGNGNHLNGSSNGIIAWQWLAGNSTASNSNGSITSTVSVNQTAGFSIVSWTGSGANATVGHGLGAVPKWILVKNRDETQDWAVYSSEVPNGQYIILNSTAAKSGTDGASHFNDTQPTSSVFSVGTNLRTNGSSDAMIAYCWCEKPGFSKFGSFEGNGSSTDGPFIPLGFKPAWFMWKNIDSGTNGDWTIMDAARDPFNMVEDNLRANSVMASDTGEADLDFLSNGVKHRGGASARFNASSTYFYMAFAEHPFAGTTPATAR